MRQVHMCADGYNGFPPHVINGELFTRLIKLYREVGGTYLCWL